MTLSPNLRKQRLRNLLLKLGGDEALLKAYLGRVDRATAENLLPDEAVIAALLEEKAAAESQKPDGPKSPLYQAPLLCPAHAPAKPFDGWFSLGHQRFEENLFGIPRSLGALDGYAPVDYLLLEVQVCPVCWFASPSRQDFGKPGEPRELTPKFLEALTLGQPERARVAKPHARGLGRADRDADAARTAFALALLSTRAEVQTGNPAALFKQAHIHLAAARLDEDAGRLGEARLGLEAALAAYRSYLTGELPAAREAKTLRQITALAVALGQDELAERTRGSLFNLRYKTQQRLKEVEAGLEDAVAAYEKYFRQADEVWQDRAHLRFPV